MKWDADENTALRRLALAAVLLAVLVAPAAAAATELTCDLVMPGGALVPRGVTPRIGNLQPITLKVVLGGSSLKLDEMRLKTIGADEANLTVLVSRVTGLQKSAAAGNVRVVGLRQEQGRQEMMLTLEVPQDGITRRENIAAYVSGVAAKAGPADSDLAGALAQKPETLLSRLETLYFEHQPGNYEVTCKYSSRRPGFWNGDVSSVPVKVDVFFDRAFFDQPRFRDP